MSKWSKLDKLYEKKIEKREEPRVYNGQNPIEKIHNVRLRRSEEEERIKKENPKRKVKKNVFTLAHKKPTKRVFELAYALSKQNDIPSLYIKNYVLCFTAIPVSQLRWLLGLSTTVKITTACEAKHVGSILKKPPIIDAVELFPEFKSDGHPIPGTGIPAVRNNERLWDWMQQNFIEKNHKK